MGSGQSDQYVDMLVDGELRRVVQRRQILADGSIQITYWLNGQLVEPTLPEGTLGDGHTYLGSCQSGCRPNCDCNRCRPQSCSPCDPCGGARQPVPVMAGVVSGSPLTGAQLTYDPAVWSNALSARAYWYRGSLRMGSAKHPYVLSEADIGHHVKVVEYALGMGEPGVVVSNTIGPIVAGSGTTVRLISLPVVTGIAQVGQPLTYTPGTWAGNPQLAAFWQRSAGGGVWTDIGPAGIGVPYTLQQSDLGSVLRVREVANGQQALTAFSAATSAVAAAPATNVAPANTSPPVVGGTAIVGSTVIYSPGSWTGTPTPGVTARWVAGNTDLGPATSGVPFTVPPSALNMMLRVVETAINVVNTVTRDSNSLGPVTPVVEPPLNVSPPSVSGSIAIGQALTYIPGGWVGTPTPTVTAVWQRNTGSGWVDMGPASASHTIVASDVGSRFRVLETANGAGQVRTLASAERGPVVAATVPPANTTVPSISGVAEVGQNVTYTAGVWTGTPAPDVTAVWQRSNGTGWTSIGSATPGTPYTLALADENRNIRVLETAAGSTSVSIGTNVIGPVTQVVAETTVFEIDPSTDNVAFLRTGTAAGDTTTLRPFLPWNHQVGIASHQSINNEPQMFVYPELLGTDNQPLGVNPFEIVDGMLVISAEKADPAVQARINWPGSASAETGYWTSGSFVTTESFQYGDLTVRMRVTATLGAWPAVWLIPAWGEGIEYEIDSPELKGALPTKTSVAYHQVNWETGEMSVQGVEGTFADIPEGKRIDEFVNYRVHWTKDFIRYYTDDVLTMEVLGHDFHTPARLAVSLSFGMGNGGWQDLPDADTTADPTKLEIESIKWTQSSTDIQFMPTITTRPAVSGGMNSMIATGGVVSVTPGTVSGATLQRRSLIVGQRIVANIEGNSIVIPENIDDFIARGEGSWNPVNVLERWTNPQGGIVLNKSADVLYRVKGAPPLPPSGSDWTIDEERVLGQDIGGAEWYKYGVTFVGNNVTEDTSTGEHGVGLSGMPRDAGMIDVTVEAVVSGVEGHTVLQMQVASGPWAVGANVLFPIGTDPTTSTNAGWTILSSTNEDLGGGQRRLRMTVQTDATSENLVWLLRGFVGGVPNYLGDVSRKFTLVSASIKRVA